MKAPWLMAAALLVWHPSSALADDNLTGLGLLPCQTAIALGDREDYRERLAQWAGGYLSGLNQAAAAENRRRLVGVDPKNLAKDIIAGCRVADTGEPIAAVVARHLATLPKTR